MGSRDDRTEKLRILAERGATEGERSAARKALERIGQRPVEDIPNQEWDYIEGSLAAEMERLNIALRALMKDFIDSASTASKANKAMDVMVDILINAGMDYAADLTRSSEEERSFYYDDSDMSNIYFSDPDEDDNYT